MTGESIITLHPKQMEALTTKATEVLYGGSAGGGKSHLMRAAAISWAYDIPGLQIYLFRRSFPDLARNHIHGPSGLLEMLGPYLQAKYVNYNASKNLIQFWNGSVIHLSHLNSRADLVNYQGAEIHVLMPDELTQFDEDEYRYLRGRVRLGGLAIPERWKGFFPRVLASANPGGIGHCVPHGEVLTPRGWVDIREIKVGDIVYSVEANRGMVKKAVSQIHSSHYVGDMVNIRTRNLYIECTPNHKIAKVSSTKGSNSFSLVEVDKLPGQSVVLRSVDWDGRDSYGGLGVAPFDDVRKSKYQQPLRLEDEDWFELMGWYLSEGYVMRDLGYWGISQTKQPHVETIRNLLERCGFKYRYNGSGFEIYSRAWCEYLKNFGKCREKHMPLWMKGASKRLLTMFFNAAVDGDGHRDGTGGYYYTISRQLADDVCEVALKLGYVVSLKSRQRNNRTGLSYEVNFRKRKNGGTEILTGNHVYNVKTTTKRKSDITRKHFDGMVYCIGVDGLHNFIIRQNGHVWVSGNSWVKRTFIEPALPGEVWQAPDEEGGMLRQYIPARLRDNPSMEKDYARRLQGLGSPEMVRAWLEGDWEAVSGAALEQLSRKVHAVRRFDVPRHWTRFTSIDWGTAKPFSVGWYAVAEGGTVVKGKNGDRDVYIPDGAVVRYREWYGWNTKPDTGCRMESF
ncbi:hypothetical protein EBZ39_09365, partial [bacterium]|nr:hypothetical protein [bacterium]